MGLADHKYLETAINEPNTLIVLKQEIEELRQQTSKSKKRLDGLYELFLDIESRLQVVMQIQTGEVELE